MKRWSTFLVATIVISVFLVCSYEAMGINTNVPRPRILDSRSSTQAPQQLAEAPPTSGYISPSSTAPPPLDPNQVAAAVRAFPGLEQELAKVGRGSRTEVTEWLRPISETTDNRSRLAREVQKQVAIELDFLRKIALEEGAKKTVAAIDGVRLVRESRLEKLTEKMDEEARAARRDASSTRSSRTSTSSRSRRSSTGTGTTSGGRYSSRNRSQTDQENGTVQEETDTTTSKRRR